MPTETILGKNLNALKSKYLKDIILNHNITAKIEVKNTNGYNLAYNGILFHNAASPLGEAKAIYETMDTSLNSINIIYGIGLGYLFQYTAINSKGIVILYETNLDILKTAFTFVDFSNELVKNNVFVTTDKESLNEILRNNMGYDNFPAVSCLPSYKKIFEDDIAKEQKELAVLIGGITLDCNYTKNKYYPVTTSILKNIPYIANQIPLCNIRDCYKDIPAVVVSAGPTLHENIQTLKKYQNNAIIICVGPAYKSLVQAGVKPDFLCVIEDRNCTAQIRGLDISDVNMILEPYTNINFQKMQPKKHFLHISNNLPPNSIWAKISGVNIDEYNSKGTVSYCALNSARILGCNPIILVGQDLAYIDKQLYSKDSIYGDLKLVFNDETKQYEVIAEDMERYAAAISSINVAQRRLARYKGKITTIKSITGELLPTEAVYTTFAANISKYTTRYPGKKYINTSMKGAQLDGFENMPLDKALENSTPVNKQDFSSLTFDRNDFIISQLKEIKTSFNTAVNKIKDNQKLLSRFKTEYKRGKSLTKDMLTTLKKIISNYTWLSIEYGQENQVYDFITKKEQMIFETFLKKAENIDLPAALKIAELQSEYLNQALEKISAVNEIIDNDITMLKGEIE